MPLRRRIYLALVATLMSFILSIVYRVTTVDPVNDLVFPLCAASALLRGIDPYGKACLLIYQGHIYPPNPLTMVLVAVPFVPFDPFGGPVL